MKQSEVTKLVGYVKSASRTDVDGGTPAAWFDILGDDVESYEVAHAAVRAILKRQPWVSPSEILDEVKVQRKARLDEADRGGASREALGARVPCHEDGTPVDPDDAKAYKEAVAADRYAAARGLPDRSADVARLLGGGRRLALPEGGDR